MFDKLLPERMKAGRLTPRRIGSALLRRLNEIPDLLTWVLGLQGARKNKEQLRELKDAYRGERCVIMGNGPSLKQMDLGLIADEITFGLNRIYLLYPEITFRPNFLVSVNELVLEQFAEDFRGLQEPLFLNWNQREHFNPGAVKHLFLKVHLGLRDRFSPDITQPISTGGTVTFVAIQIAYFLGFQEVVLVGVDHSFRQTGVPNLTETRAQEKDVDHFHPDYFPKGSRWQIPDLKRSELAYQLAREAFEKDGRRIVDATVNGQCPVFNKIDYRTYFG